MVFAAANRIFLMPVCVSNRLLIHVKTGSCSSTSPQTDYILSENKKKKRKENQSQSPFAYYPNATKSLGHQNAEMQS